ncbi:uncharacterized protein [Triticum aestivum]|uniref:uncharacterized protein isoform X1 n=1 Tax=Triticum aestivum TaxID=4565 RepID=UPI001D007745|nr:uncharacterized protein LOC123097303 isoform X1 [Triticum aestivum]
MGTTRPTVSDIMPLVASMERRLATTTCLLFYGAKLTLMNSVLRASPAVRPPQAAEKEPPGGEPALDWHVGATLFPVVGPQVAPGSAMLRTNICKLGETSLKFVQKHENLQTTPSRRRRRRLHAEKPVEAGVVAAVAIIVVVVARLAWAGAVPAAALARVTEVRWRAGRPGLVLLVAVEDDDAALLAPAAPGLELRVRSALAAYLLPDVVLLHPLEGGLVVRGRHLGVLRLHREQPRLWLRPDQAKGTAWGGPGTLVDDEGAAACSAPEWRLLRLGLDGVERGRRAGA